MNYIDIIPETSVDGEGLRTSIYVAGCTHHCKGCHNPQTWDFNAGQPLTMDIIDEVIANIKKNPLLNGITFSGGDPLAVDNARDLLDFLKRIKSEGINVWCYTGYEFEYLISCNAFVWNKNHKPEDIEAQFDCLNYIDVLVDGPFIQELKDPDLIFRGSSNQRILDLARLRRQRKI